MHVVIFEGSRWHTFAPLSLSRPVFNLATGASTLLQKQVRHLQPTRLTLWVRPELETITRDRIAPSTGIATAVNEPLDNEPALLVSGRAVHLREYAHARWESVVTDENEAIQTAYVCSPGLSPEDVRQRTGRWLRLLDLPRAKPQSRMMDSLWDLIHWNEESLMEDFARRPSPPSKPAGPYHMVNEEEISLGKDVVLEPGCVLDASKGPVVLENGAAIGANAVVQGPCYIGSHAIVMPLALIRPGTTIGTMCRVGGEVSHSILLGYSNKSHEGFLGHSYVGKWVNLGAGTTTSNLKNTYGPISVQMGKREVPTGCTFLGALIGDHTKTGILTKLTTGTYLGFCSLLASSGGQPRFVPSFTFRTDERSEPFRADKAMEVIRRVFARRDRTFTPADEQVFRYVAATAPGIELGTP